jgi:uncharacterized protein
MAGIFYYWKRAMTITPRTRHWQLAPQESGGDIVAGIDDINQCILNILMTRKGTDVTRPDFGSNHLDYLDTPEDVFVPGVTREVILAIQTWEKRVVVERVSFTGHAPELTITVHWHIAGEVAGEIYQTHIGLVRK